MCNGAKNKKQKNRNKKLNKLIIALLNIRSIKNKINDLETLIDDLNEKPHIIIITESWLKEDEVKFYNLNNYQTVSNCRINSRGGGILIFIRNDINFNVVLNELHGKSHFTLINLNDLNLKVCGFYRSPSTKPEQFFDILENVLDKTDNLICLGDANFNLLKSNEHNTVKYLDILKSNNYSILNNIVEEEFTYSEDKLGKLHSSIIDHIFSDSIGLSKKSEINVEDVHFSDHRLLICRCELDANQTIITKQKTKIDFESICGELSCLDFESNTFDEFMDKFTDIVKTHTKKKL